MVAHFAQAATERTASFGARVAVAQGDMFDAPGPFDLIWCAGAAYFEGVTESLTRFAAQLAPGGHVAFSEPVKPGPTAPQAAHDFWAEYPAITTAEGIEARVTAAGFRTLGTRLIVGAPWAAYYDPLQVRIDQLRPKSEGDLTEVLDENQREIDLWRAAPDDVAYLLVLATRA